MSLYDYDTGPPEQNENQPPSTLYSSLGPGKHSHSTKLFEMSMEDSEGLENMSDMEDINFSGFSRPVMSSKLGSSNTAEEALKNSYTQQQQQQQHTRSDRTLSSIYPEDDHRKAQTSANVRIAPKQRHATHSRTIDEKHYNGPSISSSFASIDGDDRRFREERGSQPTEDSDSQLAMSTDEFADSYATPATRLFRRPSHHSTHTEAEHTGQATSHHTSGSSDTRKHSAPQGLAHEDETPAFKLPPRPSQNSTVTSRWKRRGRLGLAKPKRVDPTQRTGEENENENDTQNATSSMEPPSPLDFLNASEADGAGNPRGTHGQSQSPPLRPSGAMDSSQRSDFRISIDDMISGDGDHTFAQTQAFHRSRATRATRGQDAPRQRDGATPSFDSFVNRSLDASDVSMHSNPGSKNSTPAHEDPASQRPGVAPSVSSKTTPHIEPQDNGESKEDKKKNTPLDINSSGGSNTRELSSSDSLRQRALPSRKAARPRTLAISPNYEADRAHDATQRPESAGSANDAAATPGLAQQHGSPRQAALGTSDNGAGPVEFQQSSEAAVRREPAPTGTALGTAARFHEYEKRMANSPPIFGSRYEKRRGTSSSNRSFDGLAARDPEEPSGPTRPRLDQFAFVDLNALQRAHSASSGAKQQSTPPDSSSSNARPKPARSGMGRHHSAAAEAARPSSDQAEKRVQFAEPSPQEKAERNGASSGSYPATPIQYPTPRAEAEGGARAADPQNGKQQAQQQAQQQAARTGLDPKRTLIVNNRAYQKISITGRGGSSKVYKVISSKHEIYAIKRVSFSRADPQAIEGYVNEMLLLRKFEGNPHIIQLFDAEINKERGLLHMVMEYGETDLANVLKRHGGRPLSMNLIRLYWEQMLSAVQTIHNERVVHADLKPANYLLVRGNLKLIDFGIAKAIGNDTTNIHRENQIGTVNYMSPEAIKETSTDGGARMMKLGRASDIWSLGVILYQMCYGTTPFAQLALFKKLASIPDPSFRIPFPRHMAGCQQVGTERDPNGADAAGGVERVEVPLDLLRVMRQCLQRDPGKRLTIPELLADPLLQPVSMERALPSAMAQMLSLVKQHPQVLEQWDVSEAQNEKLLGSLMRALQQEK